MPNPYNDYMGRDESVSNDINFGAKANRQFTVVQIHIPRPALLGEIRKRIRHFNDRVGRANRGVGIVRFYECMKSLNVGSRFREPLNGHHPEVLEGNDARRFDAQALTSE